MSEEKRLVVYLNRKLSTEHAEMLSKLLQEETGMKPLFLNDAITKLDVLTVQRNDAYGKSDD